MEILTENLPVLLPLIVVEVLLAVIALIHVLRHQRYKIGNRVVWVLVVLFIQFIGPIAYFVFGREDA